MPLIVGRSDVGGCPDRPGGPGLRGAGARCRPPHSSRGAPRAIAGR